MKQWNHLIILRPTRGEMLTVGPTEDEMRIVSEHFQYYKKLVDEGRALIVGRTQENTAETLGLAIVHAQDFESASELAHADPAVACGVMTAEVRPYSIALFGASS